MREFYTQALELEPQMLINYLIKETLVIAFYLSVFKLGVYVKDIIKSLTAKGIYNHGKPFARNTVYNILKSEKYSGIYRHDGEVFENIYPQIVPQDIFDTVRSKIDSNHYGKRSTEVVYLLQSIYNVVHIALQLRYDVFKHIVFENVFSCLALCATVAVFTSQTLVIAFLFAVLGCAALCAYGTAAIAAYRFVA